MWFRLFLVLLCQLLAQTTAGELNMPQTASEISKALSKGEFENKGFPQQKKGFDKIVEDLPQDLPKIRALIHFDFDSDKIQTRSYDLLREYATALKSDLKQAVLLIAGHTDYKGTADYNLKLSQRRAHAVRDFLVAVHGVEKNRLYIKGYGKEQPITTNETEAGRALNRRVEFIRLD